MVFVGAFIGGAATSAQAANLIVNGGFEAPVVAAGTYSLFSVGQAFYGWTVTGDSGNVALTSTTFTQNSFVFPAHGGHQWLDLTGTSNTPTGVRQTVATTVGSQYRLAFWVGNIYNPNGIFGTSSTVNVFANGQLLTSVLAIGGSGSNTQKWQGFTATFTATASSTTISFINADPGYDTQNGLDDVSLALVP
ncbi:hypothetical protein A8B73_03960 [Methylosinus sp. 3S-1]|nr:hypothetical protein A8B73_03960 [Methylosinus sp. 3S-1]